MIDDLPYLTVICERVHPADSVMMLATHGTGEKSSSRIDGCVIKTLFVGLMCDFFLGMYYMKWLQSRCWGKW